MASYDYTAGEQFPRKFGNYQLLAPLAQGGMGALYLAAAGDRGLERLMVIKTVLPHLADAEYISRFRDEAKVVVKLSHGNLIPVFDAGQVDGELFLAMEFIEGRDLRAVWNRCAKKQVAFPVDVAVYITKELCRGLGYAHAFGDLKLVHRDVSPPNILISFSGEVKLTDFGLASSTMKLEKTAPGIIYGKVAYMSPEQARGEPLDGRSDLYAAAIVLWELLTGRQLFPPGKDQPHDLIQRARNPQPVPPSKRAPRVPAELDAICMKALAPDRDDRYVDGNEFRAALNEWLAKEAPGTDASRIQNFLQDLFAEDIDRERAERERMLEQIRRRMTRPPVDAEQLAKSAEQEVDEKMMRSPGSVGRRAEDRGDAARDRRQNGERRRNTPVTAEHPVADAKELDEGEEGSASVGQVIDGRYRIQQLLGEGGMGRVYLAEHVEIGRRVAIKILHPVYGRMPDLVERFRREARAASKIGHPNIVDVTDSGRTQNGSVYFVMEYLEGEELADVIRREGAVDANRCLAVGVQICRALAAAHNAGIIHRDLKPENIFLTTREGASDFVKVLDFGIAKTTGAERARAKRLTTPGMTVGTPEYMAPEQAAGRPADERCDIYSVGAILYEALTATPPYSGDNFMEILTKKATVDPKPVKELRPDVPDAVGDLVMRALARSPDARPASMAAFEQEMQVCLAGRAAQGLTPGLMVMGAGADPGLVAKMGAAPPGRRSGGFEGQAEEGREGFEISDNTETLLPIGKRGRRSVVGWLVVAAVVLSGVGAILYVATSSQGPDEKESVTQVAAAGPADAVAANPSARPGENGTNPAVVENPAVPADAQPAAKAADADGIEIVEDNGGEKPENGSSETADSGDKRDPDQARPRSDEEDKEPTLTVPKNANEARALLKQADSWRKRKRDRAKKAYELVAKSGHMAAEASLGLARVAYAGGKWEEARSQAAAVLRQKPSDSLKAEAFRIMGDALMKQQKYREATRYYESSLRVRPDAKVQAALAEAKQKSGQ